MKLRPPSNPQTLSELMVMAENFAGFSLRSGRQIPPTLLAVTKRGPLFFTPASLKDDRANDDFADTARLKRIQQTSNPIGRKRDLAVLKAALALIG